MSFQIPEIRELEYHNPTGPEFCFKYREEKYSLDIKYSGKMRVEITERSNSEEIYTTWARGTYSNKEKAEEILDDIFEEFVDELEGYTHIEDEHISYTGPEIPEKPARELYLLQK